MRKLLITFLILLSPLVSAQTGKLCQVTTGDWHWDAVLGEIKDRGCERDDILYLFYERKVDVEIYFAGQISRWCRLDRDTQIYGNTLICVLASNEPRPPRPRKSRSN